MLRILSTLILLGIGTFARGQAQEVKNPPPPSEKACEAAYVYSEQIKGLAVLVQHRGKVIYERYAESFGPDKANEIWSGTKSFAPTIAILLEQKGLLRLDEKVHETITEWKGKPRHEQVTVRHLLDFTSGLGRFGDAGGVTSHPDFYGLSLRAPIRTTPGRRWAYGSTSLHVFAELVQRKLRAYAKEHPETPTEIVAFLEKELLDKIGCEVAGWTRDRKGQAGLAFGASMTAREWGKYGQLILDRGRWGDRQLLDPSKLERCFVGKHCQIQLRTQLVADRSILESALSRDPEGHGRGRRDLRAATLRDPFARTRDRALWRHGRRLRYRRPPLPTASVPQRSSAEETASLNRPATMPRCGTHAGSVLSLLSSVFLALRCPSPLSPSSLSSCSRPRRRVSRGSSRRRGRSCGCGIRHRSTWWGSSGCLDWRIL
jgi:CubicO group peptidase (beta-lactamase class C family)